jgi:hypothetical protein
MSCKAPISNSVASVISAVLALMVGGCNECDFAPRCEGNVGVTCGDIDQQVGRTETRSPCTGLNAVCVVDHESYGIFCARSSTPTCTPRAEAGKVPPKRCEGQIELTCYSGRTVEGGAGGYEVALDCGDVSSETLPAGSYECKATPSGGSCQVR